jgi:hypothetical protein
MIRAVRVGFALAVLVAALVAASATTASPQVECATSPLSAAPPNADMGRLAVIWYRQGRLWLGLPRAYTSFDTRPEGQKVAWWRAGVAGKLRLGGTRIDATAPPARVTIASYYGRSGFQPVGLAFPSPGCWRIRAHVGLEHAYTFVVRVIADDTPPPR